MKYVKLTHRLFEPLDTIAIEFVDYDTNDEMFDTCAKVLIEENEHKHEKQINKIKTMLIAIQDKCCEIEKERDELEGRTPFFLRLGSKKDEDYMLWIRTPYHHYNGEVHIDYHNKTVISGHTPNQELCGTPNIISDKVHNTTRYFIDGGSNSGAKDGNINLLKLDEKGNKLWEGYLTSDGVVIR